MHLIRNIRQETNIPPGERVEIEIEEKDSPIDMHKELFFALSKISSIKFCDTLEEIDAPSSIAILKNRKIRLYIPKSLLAKEKVRLEKSLEKALKNLEKHQDAACE